MIQIVNVASQEEAQIKAYQLINNVIGKDTLLALSGGSSINYSKMIVEPGDVLPGAVCVVDERYGKPFHKNSNELLFKNAGLLEYMKFKKVPFTNYLKGDSIIKTQDKYELQIKSLFSKFTKKVGVMGVGVNMHTAGIFPNSKAVKDSKHYIVSEVVDDIFPQRLTMTLGALEEFTTFVVMMFGSKKSKALKMIMDEEISDIQKYPAIFYRRCSAKVYIVTDITN